MRLSNIALSLTALYGAGGFAKGSSLALDFTSGNRTLDPRITFSRTTNATVTGSNGLIQNAPMNLLTFSEQFDNAAWGKIGATVTANNIAAPNGTVTADKIVEVSAANAPRVRQSTSTTVGGSYTFSFYLKAAERSQVRLVMEGSANLSAYFNAATGQALPGLGATAAMSLVEDGWYRCSLTYVATAATTDAYIATAENGVVITSGDPTKGIYIWGAQLELGSTATTYNPTTVKNLLGYTENFNNAAWTKSNAFVQTNLLLQSQDFDNAYWTKAGATISANAIVAPDGTLTGNKVVEEQQDSPHAAYNFSAVTFAASPYTASCYMKAGGRNFGIIALYNGAINTKAYFNLSDGTVGTITGGGTASITPVGNGWYRCSITATMTVASGGSAMYSALADGIEVYTGDITKGIYIWGAQLVQGTSAGDYKATYAAAAAVGYTDIYGQPFAQKLVESTASSTTHGFTVTTSFSNGVPYTMSLYVKAGERTKFLLAFGATAFSGYPQGQFDLAAGTVTSVGLSAKILDIGGGWYRCSITATAIATASDSIILQMYSGASTNYTGDGTSGIYIFGAQLSDSASVDPYVYNPVAAPTSTAYYGPRFDYDPVTLAPKGLLIEEQRTNLLTYSQAAATGAWSQSVSALTNNVAVSPDGAVNAFKEAGKATTGYHGAGQGIVVAASTTYTASMYAKAAEYSKVFLCNAATSNFAVFFDLATGTVSSTTGGGYLAGSITSVGNGWYRCTATFTSPASAFFSFTLGGYPTGATLDVYGAQYTGNGTSGTLFYGAQLEAGAFATSYIPTVASQVTRAADNASMIGNNFARWFNQSEGTLYGEISTFATFGRIAAITNGSISGRLVDMYLNSLGTAAVLYKTDDVSLGSPNTFALGSARVAGAYKQNDYALAANGGTPITDNTANLSNVVPSTTLQIGALSTAGYANGTISRIAYYPRRLSNTELQGITA